ncbi:sec-independent translocase [Streptomyces sp. P1-3]|uniref:sec-independent translocase n=1 Tax=Streptomyces sp. P1-3 TaxID=3421658 RepID=UPI003D36E723
MFFDIGPLELIALVVLAVLVFGPEKLPKVIQDVAGFIRKVREFSDSAKQDIRSELGPEFKDFEFEDLNPKTFARKHILDKDELGLKEIRNGFDLRKEMADVADAVNGGDRDSAQGSASGSAASGSGATGSGTTGSAATGSGSSGGSDLLRKRDTPAADHPPFDSDAT